MKMDKSIGRSIVRDAAFSVLLYLTPVVLMLVTFSLTGSRPWVAHPGNGGLGFRAPHFLEDIFKNLKTWGLPAILLAVGVVEFSFGLYESRWKKNERILDIVCFIVPKIAFRPVTVYFTLKLLPWALPGLTGSFGWVPFWWAFFIIAVADDLTQYWYHRLHHQVPWLWRFHRTHHSAPYMGMAMASRQNIIYTIFFSQTYLLAALTYLGLGYAALFVTGIKSLITLGAHSSIPWDKPFYKYRLLHPVAWIMERVISTPATHQAHHADTTSDGVGYYKGNFGNMFFLWDVLFGTGIITRRYPKTFGIKQYREEEWWVQFIWPVFKSRKAGSELAVGGPVVGDLPEGIALPEQPGLNDMQQARSRPNVAVAGALVMILVLLTGSVRAQDTTARAPLPVESFAAGIGRQAHPQIIDVRTPDEFAINHLKGAVSLDLRKPDYMKELSGLDKNHPVFIYAIQNKRSGILAADLRKAGFAEVYELRSGIGSWIGAGYPIWTKTSDLLSPEQFQNELKDDKPTLVEIGTSYCGLCREAWKRIDSLDREHPGQYHIIGIDLYQNPALVASLGEIRAVPTVLLYEDGKIIWKATGLVFTKDDLAREVAKNAR